jgi:hypothetical protein
MTQGLSRVTQFLNLTFNYGLLSLSKSCVHDAGTAARDAIPGPNILSSLSKTCVHDAGTAARAVIPGPNIQAFV